MTTPTVIDQVDVLAGWLADRPARVRVRGPATVVAAGGLRFAFYGRMSTVEYQDEASSRRWQYDSAVDLVADHGEIVAEFFDVGCSRTVPWHRRLRAGELGLEGYERRHTLVPPRPTQRPHGFGNTPTTATRPASSARSTTASPAPGEIPLTAAMFVWWVTRTRTARCPR
jgi:hypothetical protein